MHAGGNEQPVNKAHSLLRQTLSITGSIGEWLEGVVRTLMISCNAVSGYFVIYAGGNEEPVNKPAERVLLHSPLHQTLNVTSWLSVASDIKCNKLDGRAVSGSCV